MLGIFTERFASMGLDTALDLILSESVAKYLTVEIRMEILRLSNNFKHFAEILANHSDHLPIVHSVFEWLRAKGELGPHFFTRRDIEMLLKHYLQDIEAFGSSVSIIISINPYLSAAAMAEYIGSSIERAEMFVEYEVAIYVYFATDNDHVAEYLLTYVCLSELQEVCQKLTPGLDDPVRTFVRKDMLHKKIMSIERKKAWFDKFAIEDIVKKTTKLS